MNASKSNLPVYRSLLTGLFSFLATAPAPAQIDPAPWKILHLGVDSFLHHQGPMRGTHLLPLEYSGHASKRCILAAGNYPGVCGSESGFEGLLGERTGIGWV